MKVLSWFMSIVLDLIVAGLGFTYFSPDYNIYLVRSESMKPAINMGDMVVTGPVGGSLGGEVKPGVVVTYELNKELVTHRVLSMSGDTLMTKGDVVEDPDTRPVTMSQVTVIYLFKIPYVGYLSNFIQTKVGWFVVIVIPAVLLVAFLIKDIVKESLSSA